jgi:hypothetical protein
MHKNIKQNKLVSLLLTTFLLFSTVLPLKLRRLAYLVAWSSTWWRAVVARASLALVSLFSWAAGLATVKERKRVELRIFWGKRHTVVRGVQAGH